MNKPPEITLHKNELDTIGVELTSMQRITAQIKDAHRDDHYMLIFQETGTFGIEIDFTPFTFKGAAGCFVAPGQVHRYLKRKDPTGWFIFIDVNLVPEQYREIFDTWQHVRQIVALEQEDIIYKTIPLLEQLLSQPLHALSRSIISSQVHTLLGLTASRIIQSQTTTHPASGQRYTIVKQFKKLIRQHFKEIKQVQQYADLLNITPLYLNEVIKDMTGFPASYWIQQEIILEARRLLYYTLLDVKQIAWELGYEDHTYFSRFFKKNTGMTALTFRAQNHDLSNHPH